MLQAESSENATLQSSLKARKENTQRETSSVRFTEIFLKNWPKMPKRPILRENFKEKDAYAWQLFIHLLKCTWLGFKMIPLSWTTFTKLKDCSGNNWAFFSPQSVLIIRVQ